MMFTHEEAQRHARYYWDLYAEARRQRNAANNKVTEKTSQKTNKESELSLKRTNKNNLEERLKGVKRIISFFDSDVTKSLNKANRSAVSAGEKYTAAIRCNNISSANMGAVFHSKTIEEDSQMLSPAYQSCDEEKRRLERTIQSLDEQITQLRNSISSLEREIRNYNNIASSAQSDMRTYSARANWYETF